MSVTAGSFVRYKKGIQGDDGSLSCVGRNLEVVTSLDLMPNGERHQLMNVAAPQDTEIPIQYVKVNYFQDHLTPVPSQVRSKGFHRVLKNV